MNWFNFGMKEVDYAKQKRTAQRHAALFVNDFELCFYKRIAQPSLL